MKKKFLLIPAVAALMAPALTACGPTADYTLVVYNWEDYIATGEDEDGEKTDTSVIEDFQEYFKETHEGKTIKVKYKRFSTNEEMYSKITVSKFKADLICPSDYMIQKMMKADLLEEINFNALPNYSTYGSPYMKDLLEKNGWTKYVIPYMWGTMGFTYNPTNNPDLVNDTQSWEILWSNKYAGKMTVKDSVIDTYFTAVLHVYKDELATLRNQYQSKAITAAKYNEEITKIFNRCDDVTLGKVETALNELKRNIKGLEVDDGKNDIVTGKILVNLAWSGDAVYSLDQAEESKVYLNYTVPNEGSNIWVDGWVMPKGSQVELAQEFLNFLCKPSIAAKNMDFIGYTSAIAGDEIWDLVNEWYAADEKDEDYESYDEVNLSYFFDGTLSEGTEAKIVVSERERQFDAQYPTEEVITRCAMMQDFGEQTDAVYRMWNAFKSN